MRIRATFLATAAVAPLLWAGSAQGPEQDRDAAIRRAILAIPNQTLTRDLPPKYREVVDSYLRKLAAAKENESYLPEISTSEASQF